MENVKILSFDGLNRSGKGTQLSLTKKRLEDLTQNIIVVRGDGSREGIGNTDYYDPLSIWWRRWQSNKDKTPNDWDNAYIVLNKEVEDVLDRFSRIGGGFFLMDRCYISRWFVERQRDKNVPFEDIIEKTYVFPDTYFVLNAPKDVLLSRQSDDNPKKAMFRRQIVEQWYDLWEDTIKRAQEKLGDNMVELDATRDKYHINENIFKKITL